CDLCYCPAKHRADNFIRVGLYVHAIIGFRDSPEGRVGVCTVPSADKAACYRPWDPSLISRKGTRQCRPFRREWDLASRCGGCSFGIGLLCVSFRQAYFFLDDHSNQSVQLFLLFFCCRYLLLQFFFFLGKGFDNTLLLVFKLIKLLFLQLFLL